MVTEFGYNPSKINIHGNTLLYYACEWGDIKLINALIQRHKVNSTAVDIYALDNNKCSPLDVAVSKYNAVITIWALNLVMTPRELILMGKLW